MLFFLWTFWSVLIDKELNVTRFDQVKSKKFTKEE